VGSVRRGEKHLGRFDRPLYGRRQRACARGRGGCSADRQPPIAAASGRWCFSRRGHWRLSLAQNIALYQPHASEKQIRAAAKAACLDDWIIGLPKGYASVVDDDVRLSGGELQRLAIARALLSRAPIMLLDEPTSATDPQTERALRTALRDDAAGRTRLIIAHRLETIAHAEQILVLCEGRIVQRGCHAQLLAVDGLYRQLWDEQMSTADQLEFVS